MDDTVPAVPRRFSSPTVRGFVGGAIGMTAILLIAALLYSGMTLYTDHKTLMAVVKFINDAQAAQQKQQAPKGP